MDMQRNFFIGLDVGSTTVKAVVVDAATDEILWRDYQRHDTKQPEKVLEFLKRFETEIAGFSGRSAPASSSPARAAPASAKYLGAKFVQEVNAVSLAVEKLYPECGSVIELGGQDAKIIIFKEDPETGRKKKIPSMNDKCAGGTGAVIDKINAKLRIPTEELCEMGYKGIKLHPVAGKCGVFAETDINGLQKMGVPPDELMASLFEAIVMQNLSVLTRGNTLRPEVLLLGGPNSYIKGMRDCWKANIPKIWEERNTPLPEGVAPEDLIKTPGQRAVLRGARRGRVRQDRRRRHRPVHRAARSSSGTSTSAARKRRPSAAAAAAWRRTTPSSRRSRRSTAPRSSSPTTFQPGEVVEGFIGIDGGSTSTKAVLLSKDHRAPHPRQDLPALQGQSHRGHDGGSSPSSKQQIRDQGATLKILGVGTTGYAKDILKDVIGADAALVETVAHTQAGLHFYDDVDVICDVGGQDIKIIILKNGRVKDFKLNTQCSAGNGYFLQSTAQGFGVPGRGVSPTSPSAPRAIPQFGYGCAVFMQSRHRRLPAPGLEAGRDHGRAVQRAAEEHLAVRFADPEPLGDRHALRAAGRHAVQPGRGEGAGRFHRVALQGQGRAGRRHRPRALRRGRRDRRRARSRPPVGQRPRDARSSAWTPCQHIKYKTTRDEATRCYFCKNKCLRTFIDVKTNTHQHRLQAAGQDQGSARRRRAAADHRHLRKGHGRRHQRDARHQGRPRHDQEGESELRRDRRQGRVPRAGCAARRRPAAEVPDHRRAEEARRADEEALGDPHRHAARAEHVLADAVLHRLLRVARDQGREPGLLRLHVARSCTRKAPSAARSTPASRPSSASRTSTTCCTRCTRQEAAGHHLLPDDRLPDDRSEGHPGQPHLPDRGRPRRRP